jgi:hypothetical protein
MIQSGFAYEYTYNKPYKYQDLFKQTQTKAQGDAIGLWATTTCNGLRVLPTATIAVVEDVQPVTKYTCNCSKTCTQITTCAEAQYQLNVCGCSKRDGDKDGIACNGAPLRCN